MRLNINFLSVFHLRIKQSDNLNNYSFPKQACYLSAIDLNWLKHAGIEGIILDLDNTIVSEDDSYISPGVALWIQTAKSQGIKFFILSNSKRKHRVKLWSARLDIPSVCHARKPLPFRFWMAIAWMQLKPSQVVVIGDSRHTDILGAWLVGSPSIQVATLPHPLHWWEKLLGKQVQTPYPHSQELWDISTID
jgi:hypothetical protein